VQQSEGGRTQSLNGQINFTVHWSSYFMSLNHESKRKRSRIPATVRQAILVAGFSAAAIGGTGLSFAADKDELETVVVTGSRIARPEIEASVPVQVISSAAILEQGSQNVADILQKMPAFGTSGISRANSNFLNSGNGVSTLNLRNAGDSRTLVLINGRRVVAGIGGDSTVDINNIPTSLIKSVEVITGGASAVYGSEAIAGAVNFVMKEDFEGLEVRGQTGMTSEKDNERHLMSVTGGFNFMERGNFTGNVQFDKDNGLRSKNRAISAEDNPFRSGFLPQGIFFTDGDPGVWTYSPANQLQNAFNRPVDGFNRNAERFISVPVQRLLLTGLGHFDLTENVKAFAEYSYSRVSSRARLEPAPTDNSDAHLPNGDSYAGLTLDNPFIPQAIRDDMIANGDTELPFRKRMLGVFDRSNTNDRHYDRVVLGLKGTAFSGWDWDAYVMQGRTADSTKAETALRDRYFFALDAIAGPGGTAICRDAAARAAGCSPFNPFGFNSVSKAAADYIRNGQFDTYTAAIKQRVVGANITGTVAKLPAGDLKIAAGLERREEDSSVVYGLQTQLGNTLGNALTNTVGSYDVSEAYVEAVAPLLADRPFAKSLEVEAAFRVGKYSTVGNVNNWKVGLNWAPVDSLRFRAVYANAVRAPNIAELFAGQSQTFPNALTDPCEGVTATSTGAVDTYCRSLLGFAQNIAKPGNGGVFTYDNNADRQSIQGFDGGNPNLDKETAKTWTVGLVLTPTAVPNLSVTIDWYDISIKDAIALVPRQFIIDQCVNSLGVSNLCGFITRENANPVRPRSPGTIFNVDSGPVNSASIETGGIDVGAHYKYAFDNGQKMNFGLNYTHLNKLTLQPLAGEPVQDNKGQLNGDGRLGAGFKDRAILSLGYDVGAFSASWRVNYQSAIVDTLGVTPEDDPANAVPAYAYHDMQLRYDFGHDKKIGAYLGIDNIFDKKPPLIDQNHASNITGTETAAESYDPIGRFIYAGFEIKL
jgi:iron complex outermembrane recepter protein